MSSHPETITEVGVTITVLSILQAYATSIQEEDGLGEGHQCVESGNEDGEQWMAGVSAMQVNTKP